METSNARACLGTLLLAGFGLTLTGCGTLTSKQQIPLEFSEASRPPGGESFPNWPAAPDILEGAIPEILEKLEKDQVVYDEPTARGTSGARKVIVIPHETVSADIPER